MSEPTPLRRIGIVVNEQKSAAVAVARVAVELIAGKVDRVFVNRYIAAALEMPELAADEDEIISADAVLVFGGDGTVLATSRLCAPHETPMLGVNLGRFGFLNDVAPEALSASLERLLAGEFTIERRLMLQAEVIRSGTVKYSACALNEVVVSHGSFLRVLQLTMAVNGQYVTTYAADGVIIATPTGSTAYSLSAGGPLIHPSLEVLLVTPICAHTLNTRALAIPHHHEITVSVDNADDDGVRVTLDGQLELPAHAGDTIKVRRAPYSALLITLDDGISFYDKLQSKLRWGERVAY